MEDWKFFKRREQQSRFMKSSENMNKREKRSNEYNSNNYQYISRLLIQSAAINNKYF